MGGGVGHSKRECGQVEDQPSHHLERGAVSRPVVFQFGNNHLPRKTDGASHCISKHTVSDVIEDATELIQQLLVVRGQFGKFCIQILLLALQVLQLIIPLHQIATSPSITCEQRLHLRGFLAGCFQSIKFRLVPLTCQRQRSDCCLQRLLLRYGESTAPLQFCPHPRKTRRRRFCLGRNPSRGLGDFVIFGPLVCDGTFYLPRGVHWVRAITRKRPQTFKSLAVGVFLLLLHSRWRLHAL